MKPISLTIASYNIANGRDVDHRLDVLARDIRNSGADIIGVQEVDQFVPRSGSQDFMKCLSNASGLPYYAFFKGFDLDGGEYGVGVLSRFPILETQRYELPSGDREQRVLGRTLVDVNGQVLHFFVTHLAYESAAHRAPQFARMNEILGLFDQFLVVADYNTGDAAEFAAVENASLLHIGENALVTYIPDQESIDNFVFSAGWTFGAPTLGVEGHSDHRMIRAVGRFTPPPPTEHGIPL